MKILVGTDYGSYVFNKQNKTITLSGLSTLTINKILLILNVTRNTVIYRPITAGLGGTIAGNVITLDYDTTAMNNADELQVWVDYPNTLATDANRNDMIQEIQTTGFYKGKIAKVFNIIGRRAGFTSITALNDVKEFDNSVALIPTLNNSSLDLLSSSANDITGGTGARTVEVIYLDSNNNIQDVTLSLNGTTLVTNAITGVNEVLWMEVESVGSLGTSAGNIRLRINGGIVEVEQITAGWNKSMSSRFRIPAGYTGYISKHEVYAINNDQDVRLLAKVSAYAADLENIFHIIDSKYCAANMNSSGSDSPSFIKLPALCDVKTSTISGGTAGSIKCISSFNLILIQN